jgi:UDP-N-acetylmuramoyl-tripeptide--D-alanyl-D-alanine ligase
LGSIAAIADAKSELISALPKNGVAVLNADNPHVIAMAQRAPCAVMTFGFDANATVRIVDAQIDERGLLTLSLQYKDEIIPVTTFLVGLHNAANVAAAVTAAIAAGVPFDKACNAIGLVTPSSHRLAVIQANHFRIIDDCYNASPPSMAAALQVLAQNQGRKVAILGDMLELGAATDVAHLELGSLVAAKKIDVLIAVGKYSDRIVLGAKDSQGFEAEVYKVDDAIQAAKIAEVVVNKGDTVLVKGSRGVGLDIVVKALESLSGREEVSN